MSTSEVGAVCGSSARTDLCGGRSAMTVPTAIDQDQRPEVRGQKPARAWGKMRIKIIGYPVSAMLFAFCLPVWAQQTKKIPRLGFLAGGSHAGDALLLNAFWRRMKELGYVEGNNITAEYRFADGMPQRLPNLAAELVRLNVDVIVGPGSGVSAAKKRDQDNPRCHNLCWRSCGVRTGRQSLAPGWKYHRAVRFQPRVRRKKVGTAQGDFPPGFPARRFSGRIAPIRQA